MPGVYQVQSVLCVKMVRSAHTSQANWTRDTVQSLSAKCCAMLAAANTSESPACAIKAAEVNKRSNHFQVSRNFILPPHFAYEAAAEHEKFIMKSGSPEEISGQAGNE